MTKMCIAWLDFGVIYSILQYVSMSIVVMYDEFV
jgi:hypothetical protein